jgi:hypothetical protein
MMEQMEIPQPSAPPTDPVLPPFVLTVRTPQGIQVQTNLTDQTVTMGLLMEGLFAIKLREKTSPLIKPNGLATEMLRRMGRG